MLIAMAGLPGSGKSTLAARLAQELSGVTLSKDVVRSALFPGPALDYSEAQSDISMEAVFRAAGYLLRNCPDRVVILDGRTFLRATQVEALVSLAASLGQTPRIIECCCSEDLVRQRLEQDRVTGCHPAKNRTVALYQAVKAQAEEIESPHLVLDTGTLNLDECVQQSLAYLRELPAS